MDVRPIRDMAERQTAAYARMLELNGGFGKLAIECPSMAEDFRAWQRTTKNDYADTVLALCDEVGRLQRQVDAVGALCAEWIAEGWASDAPDVIRDIRRALAGDE